MYDFVVVYGTEECHAEFVSSSSVSVSFGDDFEHLDFSVDVFDDDSLTCQSAVKRLLLLRQRVVFALFVRYFAVGVVRRNALITTVRLDLDLRADSITCTIFVKPEVVNATFGLFNT